MSEPEISRRKSEHLRIVLEERVTHARGTLLDDVQLLHDALPELDLDRIDTTVELFGKQLRAPLMITSMTGGSEATGPMNRELARAASRRGVAFAVGSQRVLLRHPERVKDFAVRDEIPDGVLLGNIGGVQLPGLEPAAVAELVRCIDADGICVHLNPAQELCQPEGDTRFEGVLDGIARLCDQLQGRVLVKETGAGLSPRALQRLAQIGVRHIDVAGSGGTSWTRVERHRAPEGPARELGDLLGDWGLPTAFSVIAARRLCPEACIIGSGGITSGMDVARVIAAGADIAGFARSVLLAWSAGGLEGAVRYIEGLERALRAVMLLTGSPDVPSLQRAPRLYTGELREWLGLLDPPPSQR
jgi:isopentenyl-diphosphate delta-isomerase